MFNFTTLTIFNHITKTTESAIRSKSAPKGYNIITKSGAHGPEVRIGNLRFNKANVESIQIKKHTPESLASVEFDIEKLIEIVTTPENAVQEGNYRIVLYVGLSMNSQDSFYANDFVYKGKPFFVEFPVNAGDTPEQISNRIVKIVNKYLLFVTQEKLLSVTSNEGKVKIEAVNGYQIFKSATIQKYDPEADQIDCCNANGAFVDVIKGVPVTYTINANGEVVPGDKVFEDGELRDLANNEVAINPGLEAFGDYNWIIHNLRLPTLANTHFWSATKSEMPIPGGEYTQFIIRMCVDRDGIAGGILGQRATTVTTHVLYVLDQGNNVSDVTSVLNALGTPKTDADNALADPYAGAQ